MAVYNKAGVAICYDRLLGNFTDEQCTNAFLAYMAQKCTKFGMSGTTYANPSGLTIDSISTPQDELKLGLMASVNPKVLDIWSMPTTTFSIAGDHARNLEVSGANSTYISTLSSAGYTFLGGKGGSLTSDGYDRAMVCAVGISDKTVIIGAMARGQSAYNNLYLSVKEICDMVAASLAGQTPTQGTNLTTLISNGGGYASCIVPNIPGAYANLVTPAALLSRDNSIYASDTASRRPASTTKIMTLLCALDYIENPYDLVTVKASDISTGSGSTFYDGDILTMHDALRIMMMESSNTLANTIARETGRKILSYSV